MSRAGFVAGHLDEVPALSFAVGGEELDAPAGTLVFISDPGLTGEAFATADDTLVLTVGAACGAAFAPSPWEERGLPEQGAA